MGTGRSRIGIKKGLKSNLFKVKDKIKYMCLGLITGAIVFTFTYGALVLYNDICMSLKQARNIERTRIKANNIKGKGGLDKTEREERVKDTKDTKDQNLSLYVRALTNIGIKSGHELGIKSGHELSLCVAHELSLCVASEIIFGEQNKKNYRKGRQL